MRSRYTYLDLDNTYLEQVKKTKKDGKLIEDWNINE